MAIVNGIGIGHGWQEVGTPLVPLCFRYATLNAAYGTTFSFAGWTINGLDFETNYVAEFAAQGCTSNSPYTNVSFLFDPHEIIISYMGDGTSDPSFIIENDLGDAISLTWNSICEKTCYESSVAFPSSDPIIYMLDPMGPSFLSFIQPSNTFGGTNLTSISATQAYYQQCSGPDTTINVITDDNGDYIVQILNAYLAYPPIWWNGTLGQVSFNQIVC